MLYWLYEQAAAGGHIPILNLMKYLTFRTGMSLFTAQLVVVAMGSRFIRWMQAKQGKGQPIRKEGIERHVIEKAGTPTMGGVMILAGLLVSTLLWADLSNVYVWAVLLVTGGYGLLGFSDDYAKVTKQTTAGVSGQLRLVLEVVIALAAVLLIVIYGKSPPDAPQLGTSVAFPIFKSALLNLGWFYLAFGAFIIVGGANAVNFTDGLDGLATVPVMIAAAAFGLIAYLVGNFVFSRYLQLHFVPGVGEIASSGTMRLLPRSSWATQAPWRLAAPWGRWLSPPSMKSFWGSLAVFSSPRPCPSLSRWPTSSEPESASS